MVVSAVPKHKSWRSPIVLRSEEQNVLHLWVVGPKVKKSKTEVSLKDRWVLVVGSGPCRPKHGSDLESIAGENDAKTRRPD